MNKKNILSWFFNNWVIISIFLIFLFLRLYNSSNMVNWEDSLFSSNFRAYQGNNSFLPYVGHLPLTDYLMFPFFLMFGPNGFLSERSIFILFSIANFLLLYHVCKRFFNKDIAIISTFLLSISPTHIFFSTGITPPNEISSFFLLCSIYFLFGIEGINKENTKNIFLSGLFMILSFLTYESLLIVLLSFFVYIIYIKKFKIKNLLSFFIPFAVIIPFVVFFDYFFNKGQCI